MCTVHCELYTVFSVSQEKTVRLGEDLMEDHFATSVKMSTYLVAFVICDFRSVSAITSSGVKVLDSGHKLFYSILFLSVIGFQKW